MGADLNEFHVVNLLKLIFFCYRNSQPLDSIVSYIADANNCIDESTRVRNDSG
jgi:hypothetical protein